MMTASESFCHLIDAQPQIILMDRVMVAKGEKLGERTHSVMRDRWADKSGLFALEPYASKIERR